MNISSKKGKYISSEILLYFTYILYVLEHIYDTYTQSSVSMYRFSCEKLKKQISVKKLITLILKGTFSFAYTVGVNMNDKNSF